MTRIFSIFETIISALMVGGNFLGREGLKSAGIDRLSKFGQGKKKSSGGGSPFDNPFQKQSKSKQPDSIQLGIPKKVRGHSLSNSTFGCGKDKTPIVNYSDIKLNDEYQKSLTEKHQQAMLSGFGKSTNRLPSKLQQAPILSRDGKKKHLPTAHQHQACEKDLQKGVYQGAKLKKNEGKQSGSRESGQRESGPGGMSPNSVRNFIKF